MDRGGRDSNTNAGTTDIPRSDVAHHREPMFRTRGDPRVTWLRRGSDPISSLLLASAIGIYALVIVGATVSITEASATCSTWPTCNGQWLVPLNETGLLVAMGHRILALVVGGLVIATLLLTWIRGAPRRVRWAMLLVALLYPIQVGVGAMAALSGGAVPFPTLHLGMAMSIFVGVLVAFVWWLEETTDHVESTFDDVEAARSRDPPATEATSPGSLGVARAYLQLTKPRLMWLLCFVALAGMGLATATSGIPLTAAMVVGTMLGGVLAIGASGTFNHILERDVDEKMGRTSDRPTVTETVSIRGATTFGILLAAASVAVFLILVNRLAAVLGLTAIVFYSIIYTVVLKPNTSQNIVIGGAVGALPGLIGWAAVTGSIGLPAIILGVLIFMWTPAHFYNLALAYKQDYARGGFPMLPITHGEETTLRHIAWYFGATVLTAVVLGIVAPLGLLYAITVVAFAGIFLYTIVQLYRVRTPEVAFRTFHASNAFLGVVMLVLILDTIVL